MEASRLSILINQYVQTDEGPVTPLGLVRRTLESLQPSDVQLPDGDVRFFAIGEELRDALVEKLEAAEELETR